MRCEHARDRIGMLIDGELRAGERAGLQAQTADCAECARYREELERLGQHLQQLRQAAPARLLDRVSVRLAVEAAEPDAGEIAAPTRPAWARNLVARVRYDLRPALRQAAVVLVACAISIAGALWWAQRIHEETALSHDVLAAHVRSLLQDNAVQIASLDTHTVKPWFAGRLEYSPVVKDLSSEGFQLVGGRLDYVDGHRVAALVYRRRLHQISVFVWPSHGEAIARSSARLDGYNVLTWSRGSMTYWAVSDLNEGELRELQVLL